MSLPLQQSGGGSISVPASAKVLGSNASNQLVDNSTIPNGAAATTQAAGDNSTKLATTAYVDNQAPPAPTGSYFWGYTYDPNSFQSTNVQDPGLRGANVINVIMMNVREDRVINKIAFRLDTPKSINMIFGFYTLAGNLVGDTGLRSAASANNSYTLSSPITLPAGWYYYAWACDTLGSAAAMPSLAVQPLDNSDGYINLDMQRWGKLDNSHLVSSGHMPPTMGTVLNTVTPPVNCIFIT